MNSNNKLRSKKTFPSLILFLIIGLIQFSCQSNSGIKRTTAEDLIHDMTEAMGGLEKYRLLKDVSFTYTYRDTTKGTQDVSHEQFLYEGELSMAEYSEHTKNVFPESPNPVIQGWDGHQAWLIVDSNFIPAPPALRVAKFSRNTAFFWFNMMYKIADPEANYKVLSNRNFDGIEYKIVEITYGENVGDAQDRFILYLNPKTKLVDQFLFSNMFFNASEPRMMQVQYEEFNGLKFPTYRRYKPADWDGNILPDTHWSEQISTHINFNTGLLKSDFEKPMLQFIPMADIRNDHLKKGITNEDKVKGKELLGEMEEASHYDNWKKYKTGYFEQTADWYDNETNWTVNPQKFSLSCELGTVDGKLTLLNGPEKGKSWRVKNKTAFLINPDGKEKQVKDDMPVHKTIFKSYWFQLPFKIREADLISYAGQREIEGVLYDVLFATWKTETPNSKFDQYMIYINPESHLIDYLEFTLRENHPMASGISRFDEYKEVNGVMLAHAQYITMGTLNHPLKKLHENHYNIIRFD
jgi:hypothetical protein